LNQAGVNPKGRYVLYWMVAARRVRYNHGLQRAKEMALEMDRPLLILEALRVGYEWASERLHRFIMQGMADNARRLARYPMHYYPYVEEKPGQGKGLLAALAKGSCLVVTDEFPCFFIPRMQKSAAGQVKVRMEAIDSCGLMPLGATEKAFNTAYSFRRFLQKNLPEHLDHPPMPDPLQGARLKPPPKLPREITRKWPPASAAMLKGGSGFLDRLPLDHSVKYASLKGGSGAAEAALTEFISHKLEQYEDRNQPSASVTSGLSPYLHFGHISPHQVFEELVRNQGWMPFRLSRRTRGQRQGWWGMSAPAEAFLDQLVTWRELGYVFCWHRPDYDQSESLPLWAQETLAEHAPDPREYLYNLEDFARARTHDPLWNAAQNQLLQEGIMHNYLRMLWGKKILQWSRTPAQALATMIELNNRYALDGRDPNSYSGIFWCLGRFDRAWGPQRPVFGKVRYMSSRNTARKLKVTEYLARYGGQEA
jgi:deoxyribodipyrimidine photo-lyase